MTIEIVPVKSSREINEFIHLQHSLYKDDPHWVPPLIMDEKLKLNPKKYAFYKHAQVQPFLARQAGKPVGRITAQIDDIHNKFHEEKAGFFGFFETIKNPEVASALLNAAAKWLKARKMEVIRGPFSFNTNGESGLLVDGFDSSPRLLMPYSPPYYADYITQNGFSKAKDLIALDAPLDANYKKIVEEMRPTLVALAERAKSKGYTIRNINLKNFKAEVDRLFEIYNAAWEKNWGFVPMTEDEFVAQAKELKRIVVPDLAVIVELGNEPVGFGLALPDFNQALKPIHGRLLPFGIFKLLSEAKKVNALRLLTLGFKKTVRKRGVDAMLYLRMLDAALAHPEFKVCECSWILEDNVLMLRIIERVGGKPVKTYRVYEKRL
jgi:hypothetical protein